MICARLSALSATGFIGAGTLMYQSRRIHLAPGPEQYEESSLCGLPVFSMIAPPPAGSVQAIPEGPP